MTKDIYRSLQQAAMQGTVQDDQNPIFIFSLTNSMLLLQIVNGELDARELAKYELMSRGLSTANGFFIGFAKAEEPYSSTH